MKETSDSTRPGWIFALMVVTLGATFLEVVINWTIAPMNGNWLLMAAKACTYSVYLPFVGGRHEFCAIVCPEDARLDKIIRSAAATDCQFSAVRVFACRARGVMVRQRTRGNRRSNGQPGKAEEAY